MALDLVAELEALVDALNAGGIAYALCGGLAVVVHGHVRATKDVDLLVQPQDVERIRSLVRGLGYDLDAAPMTFGAGTPNERHVQRISKVDEESKLLVPLDLIEVVPVYEAAWRDRVRLAWRDRTLCCVSRAGLLLMKRVAGRPQDLVDIDALERGDDQT